MTTPALQYYLHDEWDAFRIELSGPLSGEGARSVYQAWRTALSVTAARRLVIDVTYVREADKVGRTLLRLWHRHGARIIAGSPESRALAESIVGETLPQAPAKPGFFERLSRKFRGFFAGAVVPANADGLPSSSVAAPKKNTENTAFAGGLELASRMHESIVQVGKDPRHKGEMKCCE